MKNVPTVSFARDIRPLFSESSLSCFHCPVISFLRVTNRRSMRMQSSANPMVPRTVEFKDGIIQCPWHGSQFAVSDGQVVHGPSVHPQACFDARIHNGQVEVRRHVESPNNGNERTEEAA